jgi:23S rRNA pseudouridine1911/1915/1917 synthase
MKQHTTPHIRLCPSRPEIEVLYEDAELFIINKPAGLLVVPDHDDPQRENLTALLQNALRTRRPWTQEHGVTYLSNAYRLESGASGVLVLARSKATLVKLAGQFRDRIPRIKYTALVQGAFPEDPLEIDLPLARDPIQPAYCTVNKEHGKPAQTRFSLLERYRDYTLIQAEPATDRLHQIRVHLRAAGYPLVADAEYGIAQPLLLSEIKKHYKMKPEGERPLLDRFALHAGQLDMLHPATGAPLVITAPWPKDLSVAVKYLRKFAA